MLNLFLDDLLHFRQRKFSDKGIFHFKKNKSVYFCTVIFVNIVFVYVRKVRNFSDLSIYLQEDPKKECAGKMRQLS